MDERITNIYDLYQNKKYDEAIKYGLSVIHQPMGRLCKANIYNILAHAAFPTLDTDRFVRWEAKAAECIPNEMWKERLRMWGDTIFMMHYLPDISDMELANAHCLAQNIVADVPWIYNEERKIELAKKYSGKLYNYKKLRIGYISADFLNSVNMTFVIQLLGAYHKSRFEVHCYSLNSYEDSVSEQIKELVDCWHDVHGEEPEKIADIIYNDKIDILVDISIYSGGSETLPVVAYKPAPIIIGGIGYMSTSGIKAMDYFITDVYCDPYGVGDNHFSEKLIRLPHTHFCYTPHEYSQKYNVNTTIHPEVTFGSLNNIYKLNKETLLVWKNIMDRVPNSKLIIQSQGSQLALDTFRNRLGEVFCDMSRVEIRPASIDYMATYNDIDIALDTYPYTGGGTTFDALYMGVPVVSRYGTRHGTRFGYSILKNMGLDDLAVDSWQNYEEVAVTLANNKELLKELHGCLRDVMQRSPLMNARLYVEAVEEKYRLVWEEFLRKYA